MTRAINKSERLKMKAPLRKAVGAARMFAERASRACENNRDGC